MVMHAVAVTKDEDAPWARKVIGDHDPLALQRALFFYVGEGFPSQKWQREAQSETVTISSVLGVLTATSRLKMFPKVSPESV